MDDQILQFLHDYGLLAVWALLMFSGIGLPLSEDLVIIPAGVLVGQGVLDLWPTLLAGYLGVVMSDILWFTIVYKLGSPLLHKRWFKRLAHPKRMLQAKHQIEKRGVWFMVSARFIPASRTGAITVAAMLHMAPWKFIAVTAGLVLITAPIQLGVGLLIAKNVQFESTSDLIVTMVGVVVGLMVITVLLRLWLAHRGRKAEVPRAKVAWLKRFRRRGKRA